VGIVRTVERDDYLPEYGLLMLLNRQAPEDLGEEDVPRGHGNGTSPTGTFAGAGAGWVTGQAGGGDLVVRLELHDGPPDLDATYRDVVETHFHAGPGGLAFSTVTGGPEWGTDFDLDLGDDIDYRVRVSRRGDNWLLCFWPDPEIEPPVWRARSAPAATPGGNGWSSELPHLLMEMSYVAGNRARATDGGWVTVDQLDQWGRRFGGPAGGLDEPLWSEPAQQPTTGHADLDASNAERRATALAYRAKEQGRLDEIAAELGVPPVRSRRDGLAVLVAAGILQHEEPDRYRAGRPAPVHTVLALPAERVRQLRQANTGRRLTSLADDVLAVLRWAPGMPLQTSVTSLAARLLVDEADLRDTIDYAQEEGLLHLESEEPLRLMLGRRREPEPVVTAQPPSAPEEPERPAPRTPSSTLLQVARGQVMAQFAAQVPPDGDKPGAPTTYFVTTNTIGRREPPLPPFGPPPRAGVVESDGTVAIWPGGERTELARLGGRDWHRRDFGRALQTRHGILVMRHGQPAQLVSADGEVTEIAEIGTPAVTLLGDGRHVAHHEQRHDRRSTRNQIRVIDLADGSSATMPWPADRDTVMLGAYADSVYFADKATDAPSVQERVTMRWTPGTDPQPHSSRVMQIDRLTGVTGLPVAGGLTVTRPDGTTVHVPIDTRARLAPGGDRLWTVRNHPPALTLFPIGPDPQAQVRWLPEDGKYNETPIWEDLDRVLFAYEPHFRRDSAIGVRISLNDGSTERLPGDGRSRYVLLVEPLLTP
jgi:hypothetical protein